MMVIHNAARSRFETEVEGQACVCDYRVSEYDREVTFTHTYVPAALRGHGIAAALVESALQWAAAERLRVVPACSYVRAYLRRNPRWQPLMADEDPT